MNSSHWLIFLLPVLMLHGCTGTGHRMHGDTQLPQIKTQTADSIAEYPSAVYAGDTIIIKRDFAGEGETFTIRPDGTFTYPLAGKIRADNRTPEDIAAELETRLAKTYKTPGFTVNIVESPGNRVYVGGEVKNPGQADLRGGLTLHQAILVSGGLLSTADKNEIALLRLNLEDKYDLYFMDFSSAFTAGKDRHPVKLRRGDILFVSKSGIGNAIEFVDLYLNKLVPFNKNIGVFYDLRKQ